MFLSIALTVFSEMSCVEPLMENRTVYPWNDYDVTTLNRARVRCGELYEHSPCVKRFIKRGERDYSVVCGHLGPDEPKVLPFPRSPF